MIRWLIDGLSEKIRREELGWHIDKEAKPENTCFAVFDTETTGLDLRKDEAISLGAVKIENLKIDLSRSF
ncbi:MAG: exonuclease domain-containing protein, partial [Aquificaceae bacterium]